MTASLTAPAPAALGPSTKNKIGLVLCFLLGLADLTALATIGGSDEGEPGPPTAVLVAGAVLGLITLVSVVWTWRTGNRAGARVTAAARIISALTAVPAFFVTDVPAGLVAAAAAGIVLTVVAVGLVLTPPSRR